MHVLFLTEKYCSGPQFGLTNSITNIIGSYKCSEYGTYEHLFIDKEDIFTNEGIDEVLLNKEYDLAFISSFDGRNANLETIKNLNKKVVMCWWDSILLPPGINVPPSYRWWEYAQYVPQILFDSGFGEEHPNAFCLSVPQDTSLFNPENNTEDFDVGFAGCIRVERAYYINALRKHNINVVAGGGRGPGNGPDIHNNLSFEEYAEILKRSKICLNLCVGHGRPQRKGRAFEIAACSKFMLSDFPETFTGKYGTFFEDGVDYVSFNNVQDLVDKTRYYLDNDNLRKKIANRIYETYMEKYSPRVFWGQVFDICKL